MMMKCMFHRSSSIVFVTAPGGGMTRFIDTEKVNEHQIWPVIQHILRHVKLGIRNITKLIRSHYVYSSSF